MKSSQTETLFQISMRWRIAYGFMRVLLGLAMLRLIGSNISDILYSLFQHELTEDKVVILYKTLNQFFTLHPYSITYFLAGYFLFWGFVDIVLSYAMLRHKVWAFPYGFTLIAIFICYELYRFTHTHSKILLGIIIIDIGIMWVIYREYQLLRNRIAMQETMD